MFAKPFRVKSNTQMKGSDKKKLKAEVRKKFPEFFSTSSGDDMTLTNSFLISNTIVILVLYVHYGRNFEITNFICYEGKIAVILPKTCHVLRQVKGLQSQTNVGMY